MFSRRRNFTIKDKSNARDVALFVFLKITEENRKSNSILREIFDESDRCGYGLTRTDKAFIERLVIGTLGRMITIDALTEPYLKKPLKAQKPVIRAILRLSVYQILYMDRVPDAAACNEGVRLVKLHGLDGLSGFVNGVLRSMIREKEAEGISEYGLEGFRRYSLPESMYDIIKEDHKEDHERIFEALLIDRRDTVRFNLSRSEGPDAEQRIAESIAEEGFSIVPLDMEALIRENGMEMPSGRLPVVYEITGGGDITKSLAFKKGLITVQDPASALVASYVDPKENDTVIDVCAAPGGKAMAMADLMKGKGNIEARDVSAAKTALITDNINRCGFEDINVRVLDALHVDEESFYRADVLIADLPCSGLGVIAKKPDIKLNFMPYSVEELKNLQRDMLSIVSRYVKPKGKLVYSICTITRAENDENARWISEELGFRLITKGQLLPGEHNDGFYIAVFERKF